MGSRFSLSSLPLDTSALSCGMRGSAAGALVTFEGWVRDGGARRKVSALECEAYEPLALKEGERILLAAERVFDVNSIRCVHRVGRLSVGEAAVWVGVTAPARDAAFRACSHVIDEVKRRVPIWKKEHYADGSSAWSDAARAAEPVTVRISATRRQPALKTETAAQDGQPDAAGIA